MGGILQREINIRIPVHNLRPPTAVMYSCKSKRAALRTATVLDELQKDAISVGKMEGEVVDDGCCHPDDALIVLFTAHFWPQPCSRLHGSAATALQPSLKKKNKRSSLCLHLFPASPTLPHGLEDS